MEYTTEYKEILKCNNPIYFIKHYLARRESVEFSHSREMLFSLYPFQENLIDHYETNQYSIVKNNRKTGVTWATSAYILHQILFKQKQNIVIISNKLVNAQHILNDFKKMYISLPKWMQQDVIEWNMRNVVLKNGNRITASSDNIRGCEFSLIFIDNFAAFNFNIYNISTKIIITGTPAGKNEFYKVWSQAQTQNSRYKNPFIVTNDFVKFAVFWNDVPSRDSAWYEDTKARLLPKQFAHEYYTKFIDDDGNVLNEYEYDKTTGEIIR